ncbi:MAG: long-chain-fatty-acid--CoA ligase [Dehalococcoidia bacterium]|jgi:acyl-CoA synthetase (AMP-forming)/AMP-acid ligase II
MKVKSWPTKSLGIVEQNINGVKMQIYSDRPKCIRNMFWTTVKKYPEKEAFVYGERRLTYKELAKLANRVSSALQKNYGVQKGDRITLLFSNTIELIICYWAAVQLGAVILCLNTRLSGEEIKFQFDDTEASILIMEDAFWSTIDPIRNKLPQLKAIFVTGSQTPKGALPFDMLINGSDEKYNAVEIEEEDIVSIMYTSGTTGKPKGAMICNRNLICNSMSCLRVLEIGPNTRQIILTPLFHGSALHTQMIASVLAGGTAVIMKQFSTKEALELMAKEKVNYIVAVPTMYWFWLTFPEFHKYDLSSLRTLVSGAAPAAPELINKLTEHFPKAHFINAGGLTEATSLCYALPPEYAATKNDTIGWATPCVEIKIVNDKGRELPLNEVGEMLFKGPHIAKGYWKRPEATKEAFTKGWLHTGDIGKVDADGFLVILDRKKDMFIRGGQNIYCVEVENAMYTNPNIAEVAVVGVPDKIWGELGKAFVVKRPGASVTPEQIKDSLKEKLAKYKIPEYIEFVDALPRNPGGKVMKNVLKGK